MKILRIHTEALRCFGYTEEESRFLYLVATHSGYFTCQQFLQFIKTKPGKRSVAFARKIVDKKHASAKEYLRHGRVFHLFSRNLYEAIGRENVRFRRAHSTEYIRTRLIALDFILRNQEFTYLESEEQKLSSSPISWESTRKSCHTSATRGRSRATSRTAISWINSPCFITLASLFLLW
jgi:hypothetical protein